jgi:hypothetical protein
MTERHDPNGPARSDGKLWAGRIIGALAVLFLLFDSVVKLLMLPVALEANAHPESLVPWLGGRSRRRADDRR